MVPWFLSRSEKRGLCIGPPHSTVTWSCLSFFLPLLLHARSIDLICGMHSDYGINQDICSDDSLEEDYKLRV